VLAESRFGASPSARTGASLVKATARTRSVVFVARSSSICSRRLSSYSLTMGRPSFTPPALSCAAPHGSTRTGAIAKRNATGPKRARASPSAVACAPRRTGAMAHGLAEILAYQAESGARGRRTERAPTTGVADCGKYDAPSSGLRKPEPVSRANRASLLGSVDLLMVPVDGARPVAIRSTEAGSRCAPEVWGA
jgi:hypothetical protein